MLPILYIEVTNTVNVNFISGIQRLTMRLLEEFNRINTPFTIIPLVWCDGCKNWRTLNESENKRLYEQQDLSLSYRIKRKLHLHCNRSQRIPQLEEGSIFFDIESGWHNPRSRSDLLAELKAQNIKTCLLLSDIIPYLFPQYVHPQTIDKFKSFFEAHLAHSDLIICNSRSTQQSLTDQFGDRLSAKGIRSEVALLGADHHPSQADGEKQKIPETIRTLNNFILTVGTIEPRKNFGLLLDVFDQIAAKNKEIQLVFAGKRGWMSGEFFDKLQGHSQYNQRVFWFQGLNDEALGYLYQHAKLFAFPSFFEGFGLPVAEALVNGLVTLSSDRGALPEVGRDFAIYLDPESPEKWAETIHELLNDHKYFDSIHSKIKQYRPPLWKDAAERVLQLLKNHYLKTCKQ